MKLKTKKIIARELLIITLISILGILAFLCTYPYNLFRQNQIEKISITISEKTRISDSLSSSYKSKIKYQDWYFDNYSKEFDISDYDYNTKYKVWQRLNELVLKDSLKYRWTNIWDIDLVNFNKKIGFSSPEQLIEFIKEI